MCMYILVVSLSDANEESYIRSAALLCVVYSRRQGAQPLKSLFSVTLAAHRGAAVRNTVAFHSLFVDLDSQSGSGWDFDNPILIRRERQRNYQNERDREREAEAEAESSRDYYLHLQQLRGFHKNCERGPCLLWQDSGCREDDLLHGSRTNGCADL